jgi:nitrous oxidase accessory protein NosD
MELDGTMREGTTEIDSIEFENGGQKDTRKAAIRFENAIATKKSFVRNSAFHNSWGWGLMAKRSKKIDIENNVFYNFRPVGIGMDDIQNVKISGNILMHVLQRKTIEKIGKFVDKQGGILICSLDGQLGSCRDLEITNNIVAGIISTGMTAPGGHPCG